MPFADQPELTAQNLQPEEAEAIRIRWRALNPDRNADESDSMPIEEALRLLGEIRARKAVIESGMLDTLERTAGYRGGRHHRRAGTILAVYAAVIVLAVAAYVYWRTRG